MSYGYFDDEAKEYLIQTPKTPYPWINYLGTEDFFSLISNSAGGYSFYKDARLRRITRYRYNDVPRDSNGRYIYINDEGDIWNPGWKPTKAELDSYSCRHGLGYSVFESSRASLCAELTVFVPRGYNCELQRLKLTNLSDKKKRITVWGTVEFCLWNALDDMSNFQRNLSTGEVVVEEGAIYHVSEYRERRNHYAWFACSGPCQGFESDRDSFLGSERGYEDPQAVIEDKASDSRADGWHPMAAHRLVLELEPGQSMERIFILGYAENPQEKKWDGEGRPNLSAARALNARFFKEGAVQAALDELKASWEELLGRLRVHSGLPAFDRSLNIWNQYQVAITANIARSASYFESGIGRGIGFRDTCQDILGFVHLFPQKARARILAVAATQYEDGGAYHQFQPLTGRGNADIGGGFNDDPLWLVLAVAAYIKETGDRAILSEFVPFDHDPSLARSLYEHLRRAFMKPALNLGPHGLPLIGHADWNDCLNLNCFSTDPNESFQTAVSRDGKTAESVFIAGLFIYAAPDFIRMAQMRDDKGTVDEARSHVNAMSAAILSHGWDGRWFLRAYDDSGAKIGAMENDEAQIWLEPQGICSMAELGKEEGMPRTALKSVEERLETPYGIVLLDPPYTRYRLALGEVSSYPPGYKENGGIFCHSNPWAIIGACKAGLTELAWRWYQKICPGWDEGRVALHKMEPYVYSQMIAGKGSARHGEAKNSWLTGAASWTLVAASQWILGIRPDWDGLVIEPALPAAIGRLRIERLFRGVRYIVNIETIVGLAKTEMELDGKVLETSLLPLGAPGTTMEVKVRLAHRP